MVTLNRAVAVAMVRGPQAGLDLLRTLDDDARMAGTTASRRSARRTTSLPEQRYLEGRAAPLRDDDR